MYQIILASESPRRKEIMDIMGITYRVMSAHVKEETVETVPEDMVKSLASLKSRAILPEVLKLLEEGGQTEKQTDFLIIGADTMVFYQEHVMGKPKNEEDAVRMLKLLSDEVHEVYTGVCILILTMDGKQKELNFAVSTKVKVRPLSEEQIADYIATGEPMDKAGAYAIQGRFGIYIKEIIGDYYNVVGFPIAKIYDTLLEYGIDLKKLK